ncbi:MAG TPA: sugar phosphate nucleotidyltransferase [Candidatus Krumholzibacterium sp.]|nr:sugar phosphate nucleotidyltransferase [Candidatus Krumholzibacterium sp.]
MYAAILAGGTGKRFWPYSTRERPKQFLDITGNGSMLAMTFERVTSLIDPDRVIILTVADQVHLVREAIPSLSEENIFAEPAGRNTAPSLAAAAAMVRSRGHDDPILCCPSDHLIRKTAEFERVVRAGERLSREGGRLVTFGITPDRPATGYGYIEAGEPLGEDGAPSAGGTEIFAVRRFHEKPELDRAERYLASGGFFWNSGIFMWKPSDLIDAWNTFLPDGKSPLEAIGKAFEAGGDKASIDSEYRKMPAVSVDYGILEKADNVAVIPADLGWNDVGSWDALGDILTVDDDGNSVSGRHVGIGSGGNIFFNPGGFTAAIGVEDLIVVVRDGNVLVCKRGDSQKVRDLTDMIDDEKKK